MDGSSKFGHADAMSISRTPSARLSMPMIAGQAARLLILLFLSMVLMVQPVLAQSILRDAETETYLEKISAPLAEAAGLSPGALEIVLVQDPSINAFVAGGQRIYIHTGLIETADSANEVQGVIAHELGHIIGGHVLRFEDGAKPAMGISLLSLIAGLGMALAGAPDAGMATMMIGQQVALGNFLAYSRTQESVADASGARFLSMAGISGKGSVNFFKKLQSYEFRLGRTTEQSYATTHPMSGERAAVLEDSYRADPAWEAPLNPEWEAGFKLVKAKLRGFIQDPNKTLAQYPDSDTSEPGHYARAYAYHKWKFVDKAEREAAALIAIDPQNPYYYELLGQIMLESGKPVEALGPLRMATQLSGNHPLIATLFGHALIATEEPSNFNEAEAVLRASVAVDGENPDAWKQLGIIYTGRGDLARAALVGAEHHILSGNPALALRDADAAMAGLPEYSADWIRAQDIKLTAENQIRAARDKERRNR